MPPNGIATLKRLAQLINDAVDAVDTRSKEMGHPYPNLDEPFNPGNPAEAVTIDPVVVQNIRMLVAAADHLIAAARTPQMTVTELSFGVRFVYYDSWIISLSSWLYLCSFISTQFCRLFSLRTSPRL